MESKKELVNHEIKLSQRESLVVSGVNEVESFDDVSAILKTVCGRLTVEGNNLKMTVLDTEKGLVTLDGIIELLSYSDDTRSESKGVFKSLFHKA